MDLYNYHSVIWLQEYINLPFWLFWEGQLALIRVADLLQYYFVEEDEGALGGNIFLEASCEGCSKIDLKRVSTGAGIHGLSACIRIAQNQEGSP